MKKANFFDFSYLNKTGIKSNIKKINAIIISLLLVIFNFALAFTLSLPFTKAQNDPWCLVTKTGKTCQQVENANDCASGFYTTRPSQCEPITCIANNTCMDGVPRKTCYDEYNGRQAGADECAIGCCGIAGEPRDITTKVECEAIAKEEYGGDWQNYINFIGGITDWDECVQQFAPLSHGCCVMGPGNCKWGSNEECANAGGTFYPDYFCREFTDCGVTSHFKLDCGKDEQLPGSSYDIYWFDSSGNIEEKYASCAYPAGVCKICNNADGCENEIGDKEREKVDQFQPYCANTSCEVELKGSQKPPRLDEKGEKMFIDIDKKGRLTIPHRRSICYNFYSKGTAGSFADQFKLQASTGLQNHVITCVYGQATIHGLGTDREVLCKQGPDFTVSKINNDAWRKCFECGKNNNIFASIADGIRAGGVPFGSLAQLFAGQSGECTRQACEKDFNGDGEIDCVWLREAAGWYVGPSPVGPSCVPRFPPGSSEFCTECGKGGDDILNMCRPGEAYAIGNCEFERWHDINKATVFVAYLIMLFPAHTLNAITNPFAILGYIVECLWGAPACLGSDLAIVMGKNALGGLLSGLGGVWGKISNFLGKII